MRLKMKLTFVPSGFVLCPLITSRVMPGQCKSLIPSLVFSIFSGTNTSETAPARAATVEAAIGPDAPTSGEDLISSKTGGSADIVPKGDVRELAEATQQLEKAVPEQEVVARQTDARTAKPEATTARLVAAPSENGTAPTSQAAASQEEAIAAPVNMEKHATNEDATKNTELLQPVSQSVEASWIAKVSKQSVIEAFLPLVALTPVLAAADFHADIDESSPGAPLVRFPSIDYAVHVEDLHNYN